MLQKKASTGPARAPPASSRSTAGVSLTSRAAVPMPYRCGNSTRNPACSWRTASFFPRPSRALHGWTRTRFSSPPTGVKARQRPQALHALPSDGREARRIYVNVLMHRATFYEHATHVLEGGQLTLLDLPLDAHPALLQDQLIVYLRSDWELGGRTLPGGSLVSTPFEDYQAGERDFTEIIVPGSRETVRSRQLSRGYLLVQMPNNVQGELRRYQYQNGEWSYETVRRPRWETSAWWPALRRRITTSLCTVALRSLRRCIWPKKTVTYGR
jgi:hypothetical protein